MTCDLSTPSYTYGTNFRIELRDMLRYEDFSFRQGENKLFTQVLLKIGGESQGDQSGTDATYVGDEQGFEAQDTQKMVNDAGVSPGDDPQRAIDKLIAATPPPAADPVVPPGTEIAQPAADPNAKTPQEQFIEIVNVMNTKQIPEAQVNEVCAQFGVEKMSALMANAAVMPVVKAMLEAM